MPTTAASRGGYNGVNIATGGPPSDG